MAFSVSPHLRVAAYCRVSTDKEDQRNSLAAQQQYFQSYLDTHPHWINVGIFADEGLSGTSIRHRPQFQSMLSLALEGHIDLILTKEVSRFARNTVDTLQLTRHLKELGVGVLFLSDNIDTRDNDGEFRLTIMASVAQEESRKISQRTRWGQLQAMKRGVVFGNSSLYGYILHSGQLVVEPEQAAVVRMIFDKVLLEGKGSHVIARELTQAGIAPPLRPQGPWSPAMVLRILNNEKYCGDLLQKKYRTTDHLTHRKVPNDGAEEQIYLKDHHQAIVSRSDFQAVQAELSRRAGLSADKSRFSSRYWHSGKIKCGFCGQGFALKRTRRPDGEEYVRFVCRGRLGGSGCPMRAIRGELVSTSARAVLACLPLDRAAILLQVTCSLSDLDAADSRRSSQKALLHQALERQQLRKTRALEAYLDGTLNRSDMEFLTTRCQNEITKFQTALAELTHSDSASSHRIRRPQELKAFIRQELEGGDTVLDEVISRITVYDTYLRVDVNDLPVPFLVRTEGERYSVEAVAYASSPSD